MALPVYLLGVAIVSKVKWPDNWGVHWIVAIYKKKAVFDPKNYRGVHLTAQLAKVLDIFLQHVFVQRSWRNQVLAATSSLTVKAEAFGAPRHSLFCHG